MAAACLASLARPVGVRRSHRERSKTPPASPPTTPPERAPGASGPDSATRPEFDSKWTFRWRGWAPAHAGPTGTLGRTGPPHLKSTGEPHSPPGSPRSRVQEQNFCT